MGKRQPPVAAGTVIEVRPQELVAGGDSLSKIEGFPVFVPSLYPGDAARIEITELKSGFARGRLVELLRRSAWRRDIVCPVAEECGGCDWTELRLDAQLRAKREILVSSLQRVGKLDPRSIPPVRIHPSPLNYRLRSRLHVDPDTRDVGFFAVRSHRVVPLPPECEVVGPQVLRHLDEIEEFAREGAESIDTFETADDLTLVAGGHEGVALAMEVAGYHYTLSTSTFFQVNRHLLETLIDLVLVSAEHCRDRRAALELYSGIGFFTLPLAGRFETVTAVEASPEGHACAARNAASNAGVRPVGMEVEAFLRRNADPVAFAMVDPPRGGLAEGAIAPLASIAEERICYLSCDPVTFSRDAFRLGRLGWRLVSLDLIDLFPNTHHIETLASFERES